MTHAFADPVFEAQVAFRATMNALARPGTVQPLVASASPPAPLPAGLAVLALTLADHETPLWLDPALAASDEVVAYLRFHTGAPIVAAPGDAAFALVSEPGLCPPLLAFAPGTASYPDRSTTVLIQTGDTGEALVLRGPGILDRARLTASPLPDDFVAQWAENSALYPCGVDVVLAVPGAVVGLPRTVRITAEG